MNTPAILRLSYRPAIVVENVVVGGGVAASVILHHLARSPNPGRVLAITSGDRWPDAFPRHHLLGQQRQHITMFPDQKWHDAKSPMTVDEHMRELADYQMAALEPFNPDHLDCLETDLKHIVRQGRSQLLLQCMDGTSVLTDRAFIATGVGPELTLEASGVPFENQPGPKRSVGCEVTTALKAMAQDKGYWKGKSVTIVGGGATAAWVAERAMAFGIKSLLWVAPYGFEGANPGGRNSDTLELTKPFRRVATIDSLRYLGDLGGPPTGDGLLLQLGDKGGATEHKADIVICAAGSDPMAPSGILSLLGPLYKELIPAAGEQGGVYAQTEDGSLIVTSTALSHDPEIRKLIEKISYPKLNPANHVIAGIAVAMQSAKAAAEAEFRS